MENSLLPAIANSDHCSKSFLGIPNVAPLRQNSCRLDRISPGAVTKDGNGKVLGEIQSKSSSEIAAA